MTIRLATPDDLALIGSLIPTPGPRTQEQISRALDLRQVITLLDLDGTRPRGYGMVRLHGFPITDRPGWYLDQIVVRPDDDADTTQLRLELALLSRIFETGGDEVYTVAPSYEPVHQAWEPVAKGCPGGFRFKNRSGRRWVLYRFLADDLTR